MSLPNYISFIFRSVRSIVLTQIFFPRTHTDLRGHFLDSLRLVTGILVFSIFDVHSQFDVGRSMFDVHRVFLVTCVRLVCWVNYRLRRDVCEKRETREKGTE